MSMVKFMVTGPRTWENEDVVDRVLAKVAGRFGSARLLMIHGGATGLDTIAESVAMRRGIHVCRVPALWDVYGRGAGPARNVKMVELEPRFGLAFYWDLGEHKGTSHCVAVLEEFGVPVKHVQVSRGIAMPQLAVRRADDPVDVEVVRSTLKDVRSRAAKNGGRSGGSHGGEPGTGRVKVKVKKVKSRR